MIYAGLDPLFYYTWMTMPICIIWRWINSYSWIYDIYYNTNTYANTNANCILYLDYVLYSIVIKYSNNNDPNASPQKYSKTLKKYPS